MVVLGLFLCGIVSAQDHSAHTQAKPATLMQGYGDLHHPVSTENAQAQRFFDQGLRQIYAFNHDEAARSFQRAADLDTNLAMAYWGVAEAVGPNYNDPASDDRFRAAHTAIQKAVDLSGSASPAEQAYIKAMALRFPADPKADRRQAAEAYHVAMREVAKQFPDDLDAATLFAESGMNLHPWGLWMVDGTAREGTEEIVATLESVIKRDPNHLGAIHYYIHSVEASKSPERALAGANRLAAMAPAAGHIVHMPALEGFMTIPIAVDVRFHKWDEVLKMPRPDPEMKIITVFWHFARGMALAAKGKVNEAEAEYQVVSDAEKNTPEDVVFAMPVDNKARDVLKIARDVLGAKIALAKKDNAGAIALLQSAVAVQDTLKYSEPEDCFIPVRESLGAALLINGDNAGAEKVFREDLDHHPRNPRSLFGLQQALKAQKRDYDAGFVEKQFQASWKGGNTQLKVADL